MKEDSKTSAGRLQITHTFHAPRPIVFGWWSTAEKVRQWSGCEAATNCEVTMDFRVNIGLKLTLQQSVMYFIEWLIAGMVIGLIYQPSLPGAH